MKTQMMKIMIAIGVVLSGCADSVNSPKAPMPAQTTSSAPAAGSPAASEAYVQIERLGRPAVNEGLVVTNDFLNAFNSIPPTADLTDGAKPVLGEAANTITSVQAAAAAAYGVNVSGAPSVAQVVSGFLPDVMRIDASVSVPVGTASYNSCLTSKAMLCGGRKIKDDVIDITLSYLVTGATDGSTIKDNVSYEGVAGNPGQPGHKPVRSTFPYLAQPN